MVINSAAVSHDWWCICLLGSFRLVYNFNFTFSVFPCDFLEGVS